MNHAMPNARDVRDASRLERVQNPLQCRLMPLGLEFGHGLISITHGQAGFRLEQAFSKARKQRDSRRRINQRKFEG
jgi:hypothetical protein